MADASEDLEMMRVIVEHAVKAARVLLTDPSVRRERIMRDSIAATIHKYGTAWTVDDHAQYAARMAECLLQERF